jgi:hypothetical protein
VSAQQVTERVRIVSPHCLHELLGIAHSVKGITLSGWPGASCLPGPSRAGRGRAARGGAWSYNRSRQLMVGIVSHLRLKRLQRRRSLYEPV